MFRLEHVIGLLICCGHFLVTVSGDPQHYYYPMGYPMHYTYPLPVYSAAEIQPQFESSHQPSEYFRSNGFPIQQEPEPSISGNPGDSRFFNLLSVSNGGALLKLTYSTTTTTLLTNTITKFCTTSAAPLVTCSPAGRRRRAAVRQGLFHNDADTLTINEGIDTTKALELPPALKEDSKVDREARSEFSSSLLRSSMSGNRNGRQLISFDVSTTTVTTFATFTSVLTAVCASTSGFPTCASG